MFISSTKVFPFIPRSCLYVLQAWFALVAYVSYLHTHTTLLYPSHHVLLDLSLRLLLCTHACTLHDMYHCLEMEFRCMHAID